jgi:TRAP-type C4-dicarboxylate transport system substrate-binding protein
METRAVDGQENPYNTVLSGKFYEVQKYLTVTNHVYSPWMVSVSKKWWDTLTPAEKKVLQDAAIKSRDFERKDTRDEAAKALAELKQKGMQVNELSPAEANRMREKLTSVHASVASAVGQDLWKQTQDELAKIRAAK